MSNETIQIQLDNAMATIKVLEGIISTDKILFENAVQRMVKFEVICNSSNNPPALAAEQPQPQQRATKINDEDPASENNKNFDSPEFFRLMQTCRHSKTTEASSAFDAITDYCKSVIANIVTPGPVKGQCISIDMSTGDDDSTNRIFGTLTGDCGSDGTWCAEFSEQNYPKPDPTPNAQFIAACNPLAITALLAEIDTLQAEVERYRFIRNSRYPE